jgi:hypothetical protein
MERKTEMLGESETGRRISIARNPSSTGIRDSGLRHPGALVARMRTSKVVKGDQVGLGILLPPRGLGWAGGRKHGWSWAGRFRSREWDRWGVLPLVDLFQAIDERSDGQLVAGLQAGFIHHRAIDPDLVSTPQVADQDPVVGHRDAAMATRDLGLLNANIAFDVAANQEDGSLNRDDRCRPFDQGDESE